MKPTLSVIGIGSMGSALVRAFLKHEYRTTIWNRTQAKAEPLAGLGARLAATVRDAVSAADIVVVNVNDYATTEQLLRSVDVTAALRGKLLVQLTSGTPAQARAMAGWARQHAIPYLDGAIMATPNFIGEPGCTILYAGLNEAFTQHKPVLLALGGNTLYLGSDAGHASALDNALLVVLWGTLFGVLQGVSICESEKFSLDTYLGSLQAIMPMVGASSTDLVKRIEDGRWRAMKRPWPPWRLATHRFGTCASWLRSMAPVTECSTPSTRSSRRRSRRAMLRMTSLFSTDLCGETGAVFRQSWSGIELEPWQCRGQDGVLAWRRPPSGDVAGKCIEEGGHVGGRRGMKSLADDQNRSGIGPHRRAVALPKGPAACMRVAGRVSKDYFARGRRLDLPVEPHMLLLASGMANLQILGNLGQVEHGDREREGERHGIAKVDEGMQAWHETLAPKPAQERLGRGAILRRLEPHSGIGPPPGGHLRQLRLRAVVQAFAGAFMPAREQALYLDIGPDALDHQHARHQVWKLPPDRR